ncbi:MAG: TonB-dependent receptor [Acidobacteria bacterium]|nr:TonB-dependent receptor [Acidobacteriota bacterium]
MRQSNWFRTVSGMFSTVALGLMFVAAAVAQNATLTGTVADESGAMMPGVEITVNNTETGIKRTATSDAQGRFNVPSLNPGTYEITSTLTGFDTSVRQGITLTVGQVVNLPLTMKVGSVSEQVTVTGEAPLVDVSTSNVSGVVEERRIQELPLNGRDFSQLALVQPGAVSVRGSEQGASKGFGTRVALAGSRPDQTGWQLDGTNINSVGNFGTPGSASGVMMGVDAVREFRVLSGGYSSEFGGYSGGMVQMITKSGTNTIHGTAYGYLRNDNIDATSWENNRANRKKAEFRRNQFGGSAGGPIIKDKAFYFGNFEALRQANIGVADPALVPGPAIRQGILPNGTTVQVAPTIRPYLDLYPLPNGKESFPGSGIFEHFTPQNRITNENFFVTRVDYNLNSNQNLFARFQYDNGDDRIPAALNISDTLIRTRQRYSTVQYENILTPTLLSSTRASMNRTNIVPTIDLKIAYPESLYFLGKDYPTGIGFTGITTLGLNSNDTTYRVQNLYELAESLTLSKSAHTLRFGFSWSHVGFNTSGPAAGAFGDFSFSNAAGFLTDTNMNSFSAEVPGSSTARSTRQAIYSMFFQDDYRLRTNFMLNLGLRYEPWTAPGEKWGRVSTIRKWMEATRYDTPENGTDTYFNSPGESTWSPRVGFAWDVQGNGKTAIRGGFGIFHQLILGNYLNTITRKNPPYAATIVVTPAPNITVANARAYALSVGPSFLTPNLSPFPVIDALAEFIQYEMESSYDMKFNFSIDREIMPNLAVSAQYVGSRGNHLFRLADGNAAYPTMVGGRPFVATGTPRLNTYLDQSTVRNTDGKAFYNGLLVEVKKRFNRGFQFNAAYTWSKNIDDATTGLALSDYNEGAQSQPYDTKVDRGLSTLHLSHNFVMNGLWSVPSPFQGGIGSLILGGWRVSSILTASTGAPFTVQIGGRNVPDQSRSAGRQHPEQVDASRTAASITSGVSAGCSFGPAAGQTIAAGTKLGTTDMYYDPCAYTLPAPGFYGNSGRNTLIGPKYTVLDFSLLKSMPLGLTEGSSLQFHADFFNLLNHANFGRPANAPLNAGNRNTTTGAPLNNWFTAGSGQITTTVSNARQLQFGLKLVF